MRRDGTVPYASTPQGKADKAAIIELAAELGYELTFNHDDTRVSTKRAVVTPMTGLPLVRQMLHREHWLEKGRA